MNILLTLEPGSNELSQLKSKFPECTFYSLNNIKESDWRSIDIIFGWDSILGIEKKSIISENIKKYKRVKWIQSISAGIDYYPLKTLHDLNVRLTTTSGINSRSMAEIVLYYIIYEAHQLNYIRGIEDPKRWGLAQKTRSIQGSTALVYGTGSVGKEIIKILSSLGVYVSAINTSGRCDVKNDSLKLFKLNDFETQKISNFDYVINTLPLTPLTKSYFNAKTFKKIEPGFMFINVGRGESVVEDHLITLLNEKYIRAAGLDVFEKEPLSEHSPLRTLDNVILTPHISGNIPNFKTRIYQLFEQNLERYLNNKTLVNEVDLQKEY